MSGEHDERELLAIAPPSTVDELPELVKFAEACSPLRCSPATIRRHVAKGDIRAIRIGGRGFIHRDEIRRILAEGTRS